MSAHTPSQFAQRWPGGSFGGFTPVGRITAGTMSGLEQMATSDGHAVEQVGPVSEPEEPRPVVAVPAPAIPPRFADVSFETFDADAPVLKSALAATRRFVTAAAEGRPAMLALVGSQGTGKSHLLYAAARALIAQGHRVYSRPWYVLADELRYGGRSPYNERTELDPEGVRRMLWARRIVLLDEVRPTAGTAFDDTELAKFSCHAYDNNLAVLITSNVNPLAEVMGPPAASRYAQIIIDGRDRRRHVAGDGH